MKFMSIVCLLAAVSCAHHHHHHNKKVHSAMSNEKVKASAVKVTEGNEVCFDITLNTIGEEDWEVEPTNWTMAWVDADAKEHPIRYTQRGPASVPQQDEAAAPYGAFKEWNNSFRTCAPGAKMNEVKSLILVPKDLTDKEVETLKLNWN